MSPKSSWQSCLAILLIYTLTIWCRTSCTAVAESTLPKLYEPKSFTASDISSGNCPLSREIENFVRNRVDTDLTPLLEGLNLPTEAAPTTTTATATTEPPGPTLFTCNGTPGWRRVTLIDLKNSSQFCPPGLQLTTFSRRSCGHIHPNPGCSSTVFNTGGLEYGQVCGRVIGYQFGLSHAFFENTIDRTTSIEEHYVSGVSLTHGAVGRRRHIWTFAAGLTESDPGLNDRICPCERFSTQTPTLFVGIDYFCESGTDRRNTDNYPPARFFSSDPLWDGQGCSSTSNCCQFNNPPWFTKNLPRRTNDDIELRICTISVTDNEEGSPLELIELYVK